MSGGKTVGCVVVGLGIAGKVRVRDLKEATCGLSLKGAVSRRPVELEGVASVTLDVALADPEVGAVIVCTEPAQHEEAVEKALKAGKHVCCEYPLALSHAKAQEFYSLADEKGVVLHEENIALLTPNFLSVAAKAKESAITNASYKLQGKHNGWVEDFSKSGLPFFTGISGLQVMLRLIGGPLTVQSASLSQHDGGWSASAQLTGPNDCPVSITQTRLPEAARIKEESFTFADGSVMDTHKIHAQSSGKPGLFMQDLILFAEAVAEGKTNPDGKKLTLDSLQLAESIHAKF